MELEEFIKNSLVSIRNGVRMANNELRQKGEEKRIFKLEAHSGEGKHIFFDVAVRATHESGKSGSGGIKIAVVDMGGEKSSKDFQESVSRLKFAVKIDWPAI